MRNKEKQCSQYSSTKAALYSADNREAVPPLKEIFVMNRRGRPCRYEPEI
jgi:hypothetical protein